MHWQAPMTAATSSGAEQAPLLQRLEWVKSLLELILLLLAIPWVLGRLIREGTSGLRDLADGHFG